MPDDLTNKAPQDRLDINAAIQRRHPDSLLNWTERIIRMRKEVPEVGWGDFTVIPSHDPAVLVMRYDWRNNWVLFVHNLDAKPREVTFSVGLEGESTEHGNLLVNLFGRRAQPRRQERQASARDRSLWLSVVPRRRAGVSASPFRHRSADKAVEDLIGAGENLPREKGHLLARPMKAISIELPN